jgi:hypothetical protein
MNLDVFDDMDAEQLRDYIRFLLWHYRLVDAVWFLRVEDRFDRPTAEAVNEEVWAGIGPKAARDLVKAFDIREKGLEGFLKVHNLYPWTVLTGYNVEWDGDDLILSVPHCPPQEARIKHGMGEFSCKEMHKGEFTRFAQQVDPRIRVECIYAPPDPHPQELFCKWRFTLADEPAEAEGK